MIAVRRLKSRSLNSLACFMLLSALCVVILSHSIKSHILQSYLKDVLV